MLQNNFSVPVRLCEALAYFRIATPLATEDRTCTAGESGCCFGVTELCGTTRCDAPKTADGLVKTFDAAVIRMLTEANRSLTLCNP